MDPDQPERDALQKLLAATDPLLDVLADGARRADVDRAGLAESTLGLLLGAMAATIGALGDDALVAEEDRARYGRFAARIRAHQQATIDVARRLDDLGRDWRCASCRCGVAGGASIAGVRGGAPRVALRCAQCRAETALAAAGEAQFERLFGALVSPAWDPTRNGFAWDRT